MAERLWLVIVPEGDQVGDTVTPEVSRRDCPVIMEMVASGSNSKEWEKSLVRLPETWHTGGSVTTDLLWCHIYYRTNIANWEMLAI